MHTCGENGEMNLPEYFWQIFTKDPGVLTWFYPNNWHHVEEYFGILFP